MIDSEGWFIPTGYGLFNATTRRNRSSWDHMDDVSRESWEQRARGQRDFIPSKHVNRVEEAPMDKIAVPPPELYARPATPAEIPGGAKIVINRLEKNGWTVEALYARGPWVNGHAEPDTFTMLAVDAAGQVERTEEMVAVTASLLVRGRRAGRKVIALWILRPVLKDTSFKLEFIYTTPPLPDEVNGRIDSKMLKKITEEPV